MRLFLPNVEFRHVISLGLVTLVLSGFLLYLLLMQGQVDQTEGDPQVTAKQLISQSYIDNIPLAQGKIVTLDRDRRSIVVEQVIDDTPIQRTILVDDPELLVYLKTYGQTVSEQLYSLDQLQLGDRVIAYGSQLPADDAPVPAKALSVQAKPALPDFSAVGRPGLLRGEPSQ